MAFVADLKKGNEAQEYVIELLNRGGIPARQNQDRSKFLFYDILLSFAEEEFTAEVKYDLFAEKSGNVAIEYFNPKLNKPSGILATKSDFWIHVLPNPMRPYIASTKSLREFIDRNKPHRIISKGGDNNASLLLYRTDFLIENVFVEMRADDIQSILGVINGRGR